MKRLSNERGIALAVAIFALVIVGGLVSAAFFVAVQEQRVGYNSVQLQQAYAAADGGAQAIVANWNQDTYSGLSTGGTVTISATNHASDGGWYRGTVRRVNQWLYLVQVEGFSKNSEARQSVGVIVRMRPIEITINSALRTQGTVRLGGSSYLSGVDQAPTGWSGCPALEATLPGIRLPPADSSRIQTSGCSNYSCLAGSPKIQTDASVNTSTLTTFGDMTFEELEGLADKKLGGGQTWTGVAPIYSTGVCSKNEVKNWGDPLNPLLDCGDYFPVIWIDGNASINGTLGQGILIVNGDLDVQGGFQFYGPVIVKGTLRTTGTGGHFNGGVIAANTDLGQTSVLGDAVVNFSSCALMKALTASASAGMMRERGWMQVY